MTATRLGTPQRIGHRRIILYHSCRRGRRHRGPDSSRSIDRLSERLPGCCPIRVLWGVDGHALAAIGFLAGALRRSGVAGLSTRRNRVRSLSPRRFGLESILRTSQPTRLITLRNPRARCGECAENTVLRISCSPLEVSESAFAAGGGDVSRWRRSGSPAYALYERGRRVAGFSSLTLLLSFLMTTL